MVTSVVIYASRDHDVSDSTSSSGVGMYGRVLPRIGGKGHERRVNVCHSLGKLLQTNLKSLRPIVLGNIARKLTVWQSEKVFTHPLGPMTMSHDKSAHMLTS